MQILTGTEIFHFFEQTETLFGTILTPLISGGSNEPLDFLLKKNYISIYNFFYMFNLSLKIFLYTVA